MGIAFNTGSAVGAGVGDCSRGRLKVDQSANVLTHPSAEHLLLRHGVADRKDDVIFGNRSALDWVIDQYRVSTDKRSAITNDPNREDEPDYILNQLHTNSKSKMILQDQSKNYMRAKSFMAY